MTLEEQIQKLDGESLVIYSLLLEIFKEDENRSPKEFKDHIIKKIVNGENIKP